MSGRKRSKPKRQNVTRHRRALSDQSVRARIDEVRTHWEELDRIEKGDRLKALIDGGCSTRGLGTEFGISPTSVRRYIDTATLPEKAVNAIRSGYSTKKLLDYKAYEDRQKRHQERIQRDVETGELSDGLADTILAFCRTADEFPFAQFQDQFFVTFLSEVRNRCWKLEDGFHPPKLLKKHNMKKRFRLTRPPVTSDMPLVHLIEWLAILILSEIPERQIWEAAIVKAGETLQGAPA